MRPDATNPEGDLPERLANCQRRLAIAERDAQEHANEADALRAKAEAHDRLDIALAGAREERDALLASTSWRLTAPVRALTEFIRRFQSDARGKRQPGQMADSVSSSAAGNSCAQTASISPTLFTELWPYGPPRTTLLVERFSTGSLNSGAAYATVLSVAMAQRQHAALRIISRLAPPEPRAFDQLVAQHGLSYDGNPCFDWLTATGRGGVLGVTDAERIAVGNWIDARLALELVSPDRLIYVIDQEALPSLIGTSADRQARELFGLQDWTPVFTEAGVRDAVGRAGLFEHRPEVRSALLVPPTPSLADWQQIAARLLGVEQTG